MQRVVISLHISTDEYRKYYQGSATSVSTHTVDGRTVRFPAAILRPFVTHSGISGTFELIFDDRNKLQQINKIR